MESLLGIITMNGISTPGGSRHDVIKTKPWAHYSAIPRKSFCYKNYVGRSHNDLPKLCSSMKKLPN